MGESCSLRESGRIATLTGASRASLFLYTAPFFVVIGARWFLPGDRFDRRQWLGLVLSFTGIVAAFGVPSPGDDARQLIGDLMLVLAGASWGATTLVIKASSLARAPYEKTLLYQLVVSVPMLAACAEALGERVQALPSPLAIGSLVYQTFRVVGFTYLAIFAVARLFAAVGLWIRASWGAVLLIGATAIELGMYLMGSRDVQMSALGFAVRLVLLVSIVLILVLSLRFRERAHD